MIIINTYDKIAFVGYLLSFVSSIIYIIYNFINNMES